MLKGTWKKHRDFRISHCKSCASCDRWPIWTFFGSFSYIFIMSIYVYIIVSLIFILLPMSDVSSTPLFPACWPWWCEDLFESMSTVFRFRRCWPGGGGMLMLLESAHMINATSETFQIAGCLPESREAGWFHLRSLTFYQLSKFFSGKQSTAEIN